MAMEEDTVRRAVAQLRAQGVKPSVRALHRITGGSFRDLTRYLKNEVLSHVPSCGPKTALPPADVGVLPPEPAHELPRPVGEIAEAQERFREAQVHEGEMRRQYQASLDRLRALREAATSPQDLSQYEREVQEIATRLHERERAAQQAERYLHELRERVTTLTNRLPGLRRNLELAQREAQAAQQEAARLVEVAQERVAGWGRELEQTQAELARLTGNLHT
jgi:predicted ribosome quality control (RQC) complex YloA/Tae2 family protein